MGRFSTKKAKPDVLQGLSLTQAAKMERRMARLNAGEPPDAPAAVVKPAPAQLSAAIEKPVAVKAAAPPKAAAKTPATSANASAKSAAALVKSTPATAGAGAKSTSGTGPMLAQSGKKNRERDLSYMYLGTAEA